MDENYQSSTIISNAFSVYYLLLLFTLQLFSFAINSNHSGRFVFSSSNSFAKGIC